MQIRGFSAYVLFLFLVLIGALIGYFAGAVLPEYLPSPSTETAQTFPNLSTNSEYGFSLQFPSGILMLDDSESISLSGYIPACDPETSVACFIIPESAYPNSNFSSAGISVNILSERPDESTCTDPGGFETEGETDIRGISFVNIPYSEGAAGHHSNGSNYRAFVDGTCFELTTRMNTTVYENYEAGSIVPFTEDQRQEVESTLQDVLMTFQTLRKAAV